MAKGATNSSNGFSFNPDKIITTAENIDNVISKLRDKKEKLNTKLNKMNNLVSGIGSGETINDDKKINQELNDLKEKVSNALRDKVTEFYKIQSNISSNSINYSSFLTDTSTIISSYLQWAIDIANDDSHGYTQNTGEFPDKETRYGGVDYDCSSLVYFALVNNGAATEEQLGPVYSFSTDGEGDKLKNAGFTEYDFNSLSLDELQPGDILIRTGHTGIYAGNGQVVQASIAETGGRYGMEAGDQTGQEIKISDIGTNWNQVYRKEDTEQW